MNKSLGCTKSKTPHKFSHFAIASRAQLLKRLASFKSRVSNPSVNHPKTGASSSRACCCHSLAGDEKVSDLSSRTIVRVHHEHREELADQLRLVVQRWQPDVEVGLEWIR